MNEDNEQSSYTPQLQPEKPKINNKIIVFTIATVLVVVGLGALAYLYINEKSTNKELNQKVSKLESAQSTVGQSTSKDEGTTTLDGKISYVSDVGAFSLNLPNNYRIVEYIDGGGEGGSATKIEIGSVSDKGSGIVDNNYLKVVSIEAWPKNEADSLQSIIDTKIDKNYEYQKYDDKQIAGTNAKVYSVPGLDVTYYYFLENNDAIIMITSSSNDSAKITDTINGLSFVY